MADPMRSYFLTYYAIGIAITLSRIVPGALRKDRVERREESGLRYLPPVAITAQWLVPPLLIYLRAGELMTEAPVLRILGFGLSVYAAVVMLWSTLVLGRFLVPRAVVFADHQLVTSGPFRVMRHPVYSGILALWLGAALGTLNVWLLVLWPAVFLGMLAEAKAEERLLESKFGEAYASYRRSTWRFVPRL
jgi:protein-S-isoprenylcysteine O-methyltransferase Ste14